VLVGEGDGDDVIVSVAETLPVVLSVIEPVSEFVSLKVVLGEGVAVDVSEGEEETETELVSVSPPTQSTGTSKHTSVTINA
jgi:hypothetical protein